MVWPVWRTRICPLCNAQPGENCRTSTGATAGIPHKQRWPEDARKRGGQLSRRRARMIRDPKRTDIDWSCLLVEVPWFPSEQPPPPRKHVAPPDPDYEPIMLTDRRFDSLRDRMRYREQRIMDAFRAA